MQTLPGQKSKIYVNVTAGGRMHEPFLPMHLIWGYEAWHLVCTSAGVKDVRANAPKPGSYWRQSYLLSKYNPGGGIGLQGKSFMLSRMRCKALPCFSRPVMGSWTEATVQDEGGGNSWNGLERKVCPPWPMRIHQERELEGTRHS